MTDRQHNILVTVGAAVLLAAVVLVGVRLTTQGSNGAAATGAAAGAGAGPASASKASPAPTTIELAPLTPLTLPVTAAPATGAPTTAAPATSTTAPPQAITGGGAVLTAPATAVRRPFRSGSSCGVLGDAGWSGVSCGTVRATGASLIWLTETRSSDTSPGWRAYVFRRIDAGNVDVALQAADDGGVRFASVRARVDVVAGDGSQDVVFGFRELGSQSLLSVDLVQGPGAVVAHQDLALGVARTGPGQLDTWAASPNSGDPECCPSSFERDTIRSVGGTWRIVARVPVPPGAVPPSQL